MPPIIIIFSPNIAHYMDSQENDSDGVNAQHYSVEYRRHLRKEYRELNKATEGECV